MVVFSYHLKGRLQHERKSMRSNRTPGKFPLNIWSRQSKVCGAKSKKLLRTAIPISFPALLTVQISYLPGLFWKRPKKIRRCAWRRPIPYRNRYKRLMEDERTRAMLESCTKVEVVSEEWASNVYMKRNRYMVGQADRVIAVYDGREKGGTVSTIRMVHRPEERKCGRFLWGLIFLKT